MALIKTDSFGDTLWTRLFGGPVTQSGSACRTKDGGYVVVGTKFDTLNITWSDVLAVKTDSLGDSLWAFEYRGPGEDYYGEVDATEDGGVIINGTFSGGTSWNCGLIKLDKNGALSWMRIYPLGVQNAVEGIGVQQTDDYGYIICGVEPGDTDYTYLLKTDSLGNPLWSRRYLIRSSPSSRGADGMHVCQTPDRGYILTGYGPWFLMKTDSLGDSLWIRTLVDNSVPVYCIARGFCVSLCRDQGFVVTGHLDSLGRYRLHIVRTDSSGDTLWTRTIRPPEVWTTGGLWIQQTSDGGYVMTGYADDCVYLVKTDSLGLVYTGVEEGNQGFEGARARVTASPNPFHREVMIRIAAGFDPETAIEIHDVSGRLVRSLRPASRVVWDGKDQTNSLVPSGVYFVQLGTSGPVSSLRLVLAR